jgi:hypothetical protein
MWMAEICHHSHQINYVNHLKHFLRKKPARGKMGSLYIGNNFNTDFKDIEYILLLKNGLKKLAEKAIIIISEGIIMKYIQL